MTGFLVCMQATPHGGSTAGLLEGLLVILFWVVIPTACLVITAANLSSKENNR